MYGQGKTRGKIAILGIKASTNQACGAIIPNKSILNNIFLFQNLAKRYDEIRDLSNQGGQENLSGGIIKGLEISLPQLPEQTKIANFLTAIDEKIQALKQKKTLLEQYKKGIMQRIFSQKLRFKNDDASDFDDWEEKSLGEVSKNVMYGMNSSAIEYDGINKYLRITDIDENSRKFIPNPLTSPDGEVEEKYKLKEGDIVFARTGASVGKSYLYNSQDGNLLFAGFLIKFSVINHNPYFVYCQTLQSQFNKWVKLMSMRSGQPGINAEEYKTFLIHLPSLPEQQKIANFLTAIDEKIEKVSQQITATETYKKGLLQAMFC